MACHDLPLLSPPLPSLYMPTSSPSSLSLSASHCKSQSRPQSRSESRTRPPASEHLGEGHRETIDVSCGGCDANCDCDCNSDYDCDCGSCCLRRNELYSWTISKVYIRAQRSTGRQTDRQRDGQMVGHKYVDSCELINEPPDNDLSLVESHAKLSCVFKLSCSIDIYITHTCTHTHIQSKTLDYLRTPKHLF